MGKLIGRFVIIGGVAVVGAAVLFMLFATQPQPQRANSAPRPVAVFVAEAERGEIALTVDSQGEAQPFYTQDIWTCRTVMRSSQLCAEGP